MNQYQELSDVELCTLLNKGNKHAFDFLYRKYLSGLFMFASRNISSREDCEEIIQEVFLSIWARHSELRIESFQNYLLTMVRNRVLNYFKHRAVKKAYADHFRVYSSIFETIDENAIDHEVIQKMISAKIAELPERQQQAFRLRLDENLSNGDIAERMNVSKRTIEKYIFEALSHVKGVVQVAAKQP